MVASCVYVRPTALRATCLSRHLRRVLSKQDWTCSSALPPTSSATGISESTPYNPDSYPPNCQPVSSRSRNLPRIPGQHATSPTRHRHSTLPIRSGQLNHRSIPRRRRRPSPTPPLSGSNPMYAGNTARMDNPAANPPAPRSAVRPHYQLNSHWLAACARRPQPTYWSHSPTSISPPASGSAWHNTYSPSATSF